MTGFVAKPIEVTQLFAAIAAAIEDGSDAETERPYALHGLF